MNFYKHYIGDFQRDTGHLSLTERGAYLALMHHYYATEQALPGEHAALCRIAGAFSKPERDAVKAAMVFFEFKDGGYWHKRIEAELEKQEGRNDTNRRIALAREERKRAERETQEEHEQSTNRAGNVPRTEHGQSTIQIQNQSLKKNTEPTVLVVAAENPASNDLLGNVVSMPKRIPCPYEKIVEVFHEACPSLPRIAMLSDKRKKHLAARWSGVDEKAKFTSAEDGLQVFRDVFGKAHASNFLSGRSGAWKASFDWLIESETNFLKVVEGNYDNDQRAQK